MIDRSGCDINLVDCSENTGTDHLLRNILSGNASGILLEALLILRNDTTTEGQQLHIPICAHCKRIRDGAWQLGAAGGLFW